MDDHGIPAPLKKAFLDALDGATKNDHEKMQESVATILSYGARPTIAAIMSWLIPLQMSAFSSVEIEHHVMLVDGDDTKVLRPEHQDVPEFVRRAITMVTECRDDLSGAVQRGYNACFEHGGVTEVGDMMMIVLSIVAQASTAVAGTMGLKVHCPYCFKTYYALGLNGEGNPTKGDVVLCTRCEQPTIFDDDIQPKKLTAEQLEEAKADPDYRTALDAIREWKRRNPDPEMN